MDPAITEFLNARKERWLKNKLKEVTSDVAKDNLEQEADTKFSLEEWLPNAAKRAKYLFFVTHPGKLSHPSAKISVIIAENEPVLNGYAHTGNVNTTELDVFGNAGAMDVYKFLMIKLSDKKTILEHLENDTPKIKEDFMIPTPYNLIKTGLLAIKEDNDPTIKTSTKIKQVYFPVEEKYHLLSILRSSCIIYELKSRINNLHFSDEAKKARKAKKENKPHDGNFSELFDLCAMGYGGTQPQNISVLNSRNSGKALLLPSMPPKLKPRTIRFPYYNFFSESLWTSNYKEDFSKLHKLFAGARNNVYIRRKRDRIIKFIIYKIIDRIWAIRSLKNDWSEKCQNLPLHQKILLDQKYESYREEKDTDWFDSVKKDFSRWFKDTYEKVIGEKALNLERTESIHFETLLNEHKEAI